MATYEGTTSGAELDKLTGLQSTASEIDNVIMMTGYLGNYASIKGDGVTDDTVAIQAVIDANSMITVPTPNVNYYVGKLDLTIGKTIRGIGYPEFKLIGKDWGDTNNANQVAIFRMDTNAKDNVVTGLKLNGNKSGNAVNVDAHIECITCHGQNNEISGNIIFDAYSDGIDSFGLATETAQGNKWLYNHIYGCDGYGIHNSYYTLSNVINGNTIHGCGAVKSRGGIDVTYTDDILKSYGNHVITNNILYDNYRNLNILGDALSVVSDNISINGTNADVLDGAISEGGGLTITEVGDYALMSKRTSGAVLAGDELTSVDLFYSNSSGTTRTSVSDNTTWKATSGSGGDGGDAIDTVSLYIRIS